MKFSVQPWELFFQLNTRLYLIYTLQELITFFHCSLNDRWQADTDKTNRLTTFAPSSPLSHSHILSLSRPNRDIKWPVPFLRVHFLLRSGRSAYSHITLISRDVRSISLLRPTVRCVRILRTLGRFESLVREFHLYSAPGLANFCSSFARYWKLLTCGRARELNEKLNLKKTFGTRAIVTAVDLSIYLSESVRTTTPSALRAFNAEIERFPQDTWAWRDNRRDGPSNRIFVLFTVSPPTRISITSYSLDCIVNTYTYQPFTLDAFIMLLYIVKM